MHYCSLIDNQGGYTMNKAKLLYDVARVLKNKEKIDGVLTSHVQKDQEEVFSLRNQFAKDGSVASTNVTCEVTLEGKKIKRESFTEFSGSGPCCHGDRLRRFFHQRHGTEGGNCCKGFFSRISLVFGLFSALKAEEKDGGVLLSLSVADVPEELQVLLREKLNHRVECHGHCGIFEGPHTVEALGGLLLITLNSEREIEKASLHLDGRVLDQKDESHVLTATADVQFAW